MFPPEASGCVYCDSSASIFVASELPLSSVGEDGEA